MPQLGETVTEGKIVKWFKSAGEAVKPGDKLFEIETDKTSMEVPATGSGTLSEIRRAHHKHRLFLRRRDSKVQRLRPRTRRLRILASIRSARYERRSTITDQQDCRPAHLSRR